MDFVRLTRFNTTLEAETAAHALDSSGIPYQVKSDAPIIGEGGSASGVGLWVPEDQLEAAHKILDDIIAPLPPEDDADSQAPPSGDE
jgi:hypothetical protein